MSPIAERVHATRTIRVTQGLFVLRYVASKAGLNAPSLSVHAAPASGVELISPDGTDDHRLVSPGDALVVRADRDSFINVAVMPSHRNGSCDAELVLERVSTSLVKPPIMLVPDPMPEDGRPAFEDLEILAHVARRGDVLARAGQWICGPELPMAIEGLEIRWPSRPRDLDIITTATINARGLKSLPERSIGSFLGTRGRAAPITSLSLSMAGASSDNFILRCEALFLGLPVTQVSGSSCVLRGATGVEPLVGLRLSVAPVAERQALQTVGTLRQQGVEIARTPAPAPVARDDRAGRVKIFRSSARVKSSPAYS
jgi:hypothetical protein